MDDQRTNSIAADQLRGIVSRIERIEAEIKDRNADKSDIYQEAKAAGFDTKVIRQVVALRRKDHAERKEQEAILEMYLEALGMA